MLLPVIAVVAALGTGTLLGFSTLVMPSLGRLPAGEAVAAMQEINRRATAPPFALVLLSTVAAGVGAIVLGVLDAEPLALVGGAVLLVGIVGVTGVLNVPRNEWLERLGPNPDDPAAAWRRFRGVWVVANHVRTLLGAVGALLIALAVAL